MSTISPSQPQPDARHLPELDGLRGVAIIAVLLAHSVDVLDLLPIHQPGVHWGDAVQSIFLSGWGGVDLFFTLSGFLITGILLRAVKRPHYFRSFYMRRILRIFPIYYLFLAFTALLDRPSFFPSGLVPAGLGNRLPFFFYLQNWPVFWKDWSGMGTLWGAYWTLAVEEQFYLVWPAIVRLFRLRTLFALCAFGFLLGWPVRAYLFHTMGLEFGIMQSPFTRLDGLFLGAAIAIYREASGRPIPLSWGACAFAFGASIYAWIAIFHTAELGRGQGIHILRDGVTAFALMSAGLIVATQHPVALVHRLLTLRPLRFAGRLSYGMYIYQMYVFRIMAHVLHFRPRHNPFVALLDIALCLLAVTLVAQLSYRFIEKPFLNLKRYFPSPAAPVAQSPD